MDVVCEYDAFMDYATVLYAAGGLGGYAASLLAARAPFLAVRWVDDEGGG